MDDLGLAVRRLVVVVGSVVVGFSAGTGLAVSLPVSAGVIASSTGVGFGVGLVLAALLRR